MSDYALKNIHSFIQHLGIPIVSTLNGLLIFPTTPTCTPPSFCHCGFGSISTGRKVSTIISSSFGTNLTEIGQLKKQLSDRFRMREMEAISWYLGMEIKEIELTRLSLLTKLLLLTGCSKT